MTPALGRLTSLIAKLVIAAGIAATVPREAGAETARPFTIISYNILAIPCLSKDEFAVDIAKLVMDVKICAPNPGWFGQNMTRRMEALGGFLRSEAGRADGADVVVLQEAFTSRTGIFNDKALREVMRKSGYRHVAAGEDSILTTGAASLIEFATNTSVKDPPRGALSSGVVVFSRHPIVTTRSMSFGELCSIDDCASNKGVLYVRVALPDGRDAELWATHMQAQKDLDRIRVKQVAKFGEFIAKTSTGAPFQFFVGDFNFRSTGRFESFTRFRDAAGATHAGQSCAGEKRCQVKPKSASSKAAGDVPDHQFFRVGRKGHAIVPREVRFDDVYLGRKPISDHQYLSVRYDLVSP